MDVEGWFVICWKKQGGSGSFVEFLLSYFR